MSLNGFRTVDLFAGVGGLSLGFNLGGFDIVAAYENSEKAIDAYASNFRHDIHMFDLSDVDGAVSHIRRYDPEAIIGGPPCQDFSSAGYRKEKGNARLTQAFADIATEIMPQLIVMENVPRTRLSRAYSYARRKIRKAGYGMTEIVLDASLCGVPQKRSRFFCIAVKDGQDGELEEYFLRLQADAPMTVADYFGDEIDTEFYYRHPRNYSRRAVYSVNEPSPTVRGVNRPIPPGYKGHPLDAAPVEEARPLTYEERSRIQTFPPNWKWTGSKTDIEQMIGNAVPVELSRFVAEGAKLACP